MTPLKIVLASTSAVKLDACRRAFGPEVDIVTVKVPSGVSEQPMDQETLQGAHNRIAAARVEVPGADFYVAIESGVFDEGTAFVDRALVVLEHQTGLRYHTVSDGVIFPDAAVEEARRRGLDKWTVGKVMAEQGTVVSHDDPHLTLAGRSRAEYLYEAVRRACDEHVQASVDKVIHEMGFRPMTPKDYERLGLRPPGTEGAS